MKKHELINGKRPEQIKSALRICTTIGCSCTKHNCAYEDDGDCSGRVMRDALGLIKSLESERDAALAKVPKWIKVKDGMPKGGDPNSMEVCEIVNLVTKEGDVTSGWINGQEGFAYLIRGENDYISRVPITEVEYWMPLQKHPRYRQAPELPDPEIEAAMEQEAATE